MTVKSYPVKIYYFYDQYSHKPVFFADKHKVDSEAWQHARYARQDITIWVVEFPRTLNGDVAIDLINGRFDKYPRKKFGTARYYEPQPKAEQPKAKADSGIPSDPFLVLGIPSSSGLTKDALQSYWKKAIRKHHEGVGGDQAWMAAANAARDKIRKRMGWS